MPSIQNEGNFNVKITQATFIKHEKPEDPHAFSVNVRGETQDGLDAWGAINFSHTVVSGGKNAGKTVAQVSNELLLDLGVKDGYIGNLQSAIEQGLHANFAMKWDEYNGQKRLKVAFINPIRESVNISEVDWDDVMAQFEGKDKPKPTVEPPKMEKGKIVQAELPEADEPEFTPTEEQPF